MAITNCWHNGSIVVYEFGHGCPVCRLIGDLKEEIERLKATSAVSTTVYQDTEATKAKRSVKADIIVAQTRTLKAQEKEIIELKASLGSYGAENAQLFGRIDELAVLRADHHRMAKQRIEVNKTLEADVAELKRQSKVDRELIDGLKKDADMWCDMSKLDARLLADERKKDAEATRRCLEGRSWSIDDYRRRIIVQDEQIENQKEQVTMKISIIDDLERDIGVLKQDAEMWKETAKLDAELLAGERKESESDTSQRIDEYHTTARILRCKYDMLRARVDELEDRFSEELECKHCIKGQADCPRCHGTGSQGPRPDDCGHRFTCQYPGCVKGRVPCSVCGKEPTNQ